MLRHAAYEGKLGIIQWYREVLNFTNINREDKKGLTPLYWAMIKQRHDVVKYFIDNGYGQSATSKNSQLFAK